MKKLIPLLIAAVIATACTTERAKQICPTVSNLSETVTIRVWDSNQNEATFKAIKSTEVIFREASANPELTFVGLGNIIHNLPFEKLQSDDARLYTDLAVGLVVLAFPDGSSVDVSKYESAQVVAGCIADGIARSLPAEYP